jgi:membrane protein required for colicin V production
LTLDLAVLGLLLLAAVAGAVSGALSQVLRLLGVVAGWAAARFLAPMLAARLGVHGAAGRAALAAAVFVGAWLVVGLVARGVRRSLDDDGEPSLLDRLLGALLGGAKGALVAWVLLSLLALLGGRLALGPLRVEARGSRAAALAARHDLLSLADPEAARLAQRLVELWRDPARRERLLRDPGWSRLLERSGLKEALDRGAAGAGEAREKAGDLLADPELKAMLERLSKEP